MKMMNDEYHEHLLASEITFFSFSQPLVVLQSINLENGSNLIKPWSK